MKGGLRLDYAEGLPGLTGLTFGALMQPQSYGIPVVRAKRRRQLAVQLAQAGETEITLVSLHLVKWYAERQGLLLEVVAQGSEQSKPQSLHR
jgi:hypothetical protein